MEGSENCRHTPASHYQTHLGAVLGERWDVEDRGPEETMVIEVGSMVAVGIGRWKEMDKLGTYLEAQWKEDLLMDYIWVRERKFIEN